MSYEPQLVVIDPSVVTLVTQAGLCGMPSTPIRYLLFSMVVCLPAASEISASVEMANNTTLGDWFLTEDRFAIVLRSEAAAPLILDASLACEAAGMRSHVLVSVDTVAQVLQVYVNDAPLSVTAGGWIGAGSTMTISAFYSNWIVQGAGGTGDASGNPAVADVWLASPAAFVDLSLTANRRKFINADLSQADLGDDGSAPFGVAPPIFLTVRPGDTDPNSFADNNGSGGGPWTIYPPVMEFESEGTCIVPHIDIPPPGGSSLAMDDVIAIDETPARVAGSQVFLLWSDDRGHSYGHPVGQPIGAPGEYLTSVSWNRLGYARDRVFMLEWSVPTATALQGAWIEANTSAKS